MRNRTIKLGLVAATAMSAVVPMLAQPAFADYAPSKGDVVGVGSDTLQYLTGFLADGDAFGDPGYNGLGNANKLVSFDAIPDANARLAYGVNGGQAATTSCTPGTGSTKGTANSATNNTGTPCVLNPTLVLRAGTQAVQRPNGSGAGITALEQDVTAGNNLAKGAHAEVVNFSRASSAQHPAAKYGLDSISVASDALPIVVASTTNAVPLSTQELSQIYAANQGSCVKWNQLPGNSTGSADPIIPILPQVGSGTRSYFLGLLGSGSTPLSPGTCTVVSEENDPTAIAQQSNPADAIAPVSLGRLNLFLNTGNTPLNGSAGYFLDPSCNYVNNSSTCGTGTYTYNQTTVASGSNGANVNALGGTLNVASTTGFGSTGSVQVETASGNAVLNYTGTTATSFTGVTVAGSSAGGVSSGVLSTGANVTQSTGSYVPTATQPKVKVLASTGNAGDGNAVFYPTRTLYLYFRDSDIYSTAPYQPGTTENWVNTLFYDPCLPAQLAANTCVSGPAGANEYGPNGAPYIDSAGGQLLLSDAGVTPLDTGASGNFQQGGA